MVHIITMVSIKGGVGKTTTSMNLAGAFSRKEYSVLLIDADFQGNLTDAVVEDYEQIDKTVFDLISDEQLLVSECVTPTGIPGVDIVPSDLQLMQANRVLDPESDPMSVFCLKNKLDEHARNHYDFIIVDTHPDINIMTTNSLTVATSYIIPVFTDRHLIRAVQMTSDYADKVSQANTELEEIGILIGNYDARKKISGLMKEKAEKFFSERLLNTIVHTNTAIEKAALDGQTIFQYDLRERGCKFFKCLAEEVLHKLGV